MAIPHNSYNGIVLPKLLRDLSYSLRGDCFTIKGISRPVRCWTEILSNVRRISTSSSSSGLPSTCITVTWKSVKGPCAAETTCKLTGKIKNVSSYGNSLCSVVCKLQSTRERQRIIQTYGCYMTIYFVICNITYTASQSS